MLHLPDKVRYEGEFQNGEFHGHGSLFFPEGKLVGEWVCGKQVEGTFTFSDGLEYAPTDWTYCTATDRRFYSESVSPSGIRPTGELHYSDTSVSRDVPLGSYDAGNGFYSPSTGLVGAYDDPFTTRQPSEKETKWLCTRAPKAATKDMSVI